MRRCRVGHRYPPRLRTLPRPKRGGCGTSVKCQSPVALIGRPDPTRHLIESKWSRIRYESPHPRRTDAGVPQKTPASDVDSPATGTVPLYRPQVTLSAKARSVIIGTSHKTRKLVYQYAGLSSSIAPRTEPLQMSLRSSIYFAFPPSSKAPAKHHRRNDIERSFPAFSHPLFSGFQKMQFLRSERTAMKCYVGAELKSKTFYALLRVLRRSAPSWQC